MIRLLRFIFYFFHQFIYLRYINDNLVFVDLDFTLFDNYKLIKNFPNDNFYSLNIELNQIVKKELEQYSKNNIYLFTARGVFNSNKTKNQLMNLHFENYNNILFLGNTELKFMFLKINDLFFKKRITIYDDFQDFDFVKRKLIIKSPPILKFTLHINPNNLNKK